MFTIEHNVTTGVTNQIPYTTKEQAEYDTKKAAWNVGAKDRKAALIRADRNAKIAACDWRMLTDSPVNLAFKVYRQALRDIPQQSGFPDNVIWPVAP